MSNGFSRTLFAWTKTDDKVLLNAIALGHSVLEVAEDLHREYFTILRRIDELGIFEHAEFSEEWVEFVGLALGGAPLQIALDWCLATADRLLQEEVAAASMVDLRPEFELARKLYICVPNFQAIEDLSWLVSQDAAAQRGYSLAAQRVLDNSDVITPYTLKNMVLGIVPALPERTYKGYSTHATRRAPSSRNKTVRSGAKSWRGRRSATGRKTRKWA